PEGQRHRGRCSGGRGAFREEARAYAGLEEQTQGGGAGARAGGIAQAGADRQRHGYGGDGRGAQGGCCRGRARGDAGRRQHSQVSAARSARAAGATMSTVPSTSALRAERLMLVARYDCYSFSPEIFLVVKELETEISWLEHGLWRRKQGEMSTWVTGVMIERRRHQAAEVRWQGGQLRCSRK